MPTSTPFSTHQGAFLGGVMGTLTKADPAASSAAFAGSPEMQKQMASLQAGGPFAQARNFAVMTGVNAGIACAYRRWKGEDDVYGTMCAAFGSGAAFSLVSGMGSAGNPAQAAFTTGVAFAVFQGGFHKIGQAFSGGSGAAKPEEYARASYMLQTMGLSKYDKQVKKAQLTDATLLLWTEAALADAKIPPGPRLRILAHLDGYKRAGKGGVPAPPAGAALEGGVVVK